MNLSRRAALAMVPPVLASLSAARSTQAADAQTVPWSTGTEPPSIPVPQGAADCHHHIYDGRFAVAPGVQTKPADATAADYLKLQRRLGISRHVVVQPSAYGVDNSCILDSLVQFGPAARGVAVVNTDVTDAELRRLDAAGIRGIRFNFAPAGATTPEMIAPLARRVAGLGWHVQLNADADMILSLQPILTDLPCPLVFDHLGHPTQPAGIQHPVFALVTKLLGAGKTWVKLSAAYADTKVGPPGYGDTSVVAKAYVKEASERLVWGSDWPHPSEPPDRKPDDAKLLDLLADWAPDAQVRHRILVENPVVLYRFA